MLPETFAKTGLHITCGTPPAQFQVFGERSSGTNYVKRLIGRNSTLRPTEDLGWKHGFPHMAAIAADVAVICVVRGAVDWACSMHAKPWHTTPAMQALEFGDFIRAEWDTIIDRARYFQQDAKREIIGQPLQHDRDPLNGRKFTNLFALRQAKIEGLLSLQNRHPTCVVVRMEEVIAAPEKFVTRLHEGFGLAAPEVAFRPIVKRLGSKFKPAIAKRPETPNTIDFADLQFLKSQLAGPQEQALGYSY